MLTFIKKIKVSGEHRRKIQIADKRKTIQIVEKDTNKRLLTSFCAYDIINSDKSSY